LKFERAIDWLHGFDSRMPPAERLAMDKHQERHRGPRVEPGRIKDLKKKNKSKEDGGNDRGEG
jgi:hypothetical protein